MYGIQWDGIVVVESWEDKLQSATFHRFETLCIEVLIKV